MEKPTTFYDRIVTRAKDNKFVAVVLVLFVVAAAVVGFMKNVLPSAHKAPFIVRKGPALVFRYPGPLVYQYPSKLGDLLAPIGIAVSFDVTNQHPTADRVMGYSVDAAVDGSWTRLSALETPNTSRFFWVNDHNLKTSSPLGFASFDAQAMEKTLAPGDNVKGWIFLEWPPELRKSDVTVGKLRITLEDVAGEKQVAEFDPRPADNEGAANFDGNGFHVSGENVDLSAFQIKPYHDLVHGVQTQ